MVSPKFERVVALLTTPQLLYYCRGPVCECTRVYFVQLGVTSANIKAFIFKSRLENTDSRSQRLPHFLSVSRTKAKYSRCCSDNMSNVERLIALIIQKRQWISYIFILSVCTTCTIEFLKVNIPIHPPTWSVTFDPSHQNKGLSSFSLMTPIVSHFLSQTIILMQKKQV